jgi:hypothetical protein
MQPGQNLAPEDRAQVLRDLLALYESGEAQGMTAEMIGHRLGVGKFAVYRMKRELALTGVPSEVIRARFSRTCHHGKLREECRICYLDARAGERQRQRQCEHVARVAEQL